VDEPEPMRSVTIDAKRHEEILLDLIRMTLRNGGHWWRYHSYQRAAVSAAREGLDIGQSVTLAHGKDSLDIKDVTGTVKLAKGSTPVRRFRSLVLLYSPTLVFVLPAELFRAEDLTFLSGPAPDLPLALDVTPQIQDTMVARRTRLTLTSADFLIGPVTTLASTAFPVAALAAGEWAWGFLMVPLLFLVLMIPSLLGIPRIRRKVRETYPVGLELQGQVTDELLRVRTGVGTVYGPWASYTALRVSDDAVMLRLRRRVLAQTKTQILPRALFGPEELGRLEAAVPKRF
jgi:hypothetical protein